MWNLYVFGYNFYVFMKPLPITLLGYDIWLFVGMIYVHCEFAYVAIFVTCICNWEFRWCIVRMGYIQILWNAGHVCFTLYFVGFWQPKLHWFSCFRNLTSFSVFCIDGLPWFRFSHGTCRRLFISLLVSQFQSSAQVEL